MTPLRQLVRRPGQPGEPGALKCWAFRLAASVLPHVPLPIARPAAQLVGLSLWALLPGARRCVDANLWHVACLRDDDTLRRQAVRGVFRHLALNYLDLFRVGRLSDAQIVAGWVLEGEDLLAAAVAGGRGVVLATAHLGDFEYAAARLGLLGVPITLPVERLEPERLFGLVSRLRSHHGVRAVPADSPDGLRALFAALRRGEAVLLAVDRDVLGTGVEVPLFGAPARLPVGPVLLAQRSGAPVLWAYGWRESARRSRGGFLPVQLHAEAVETHAAGAAPDELSDGPQPQMAARRRTRPHDRAALPEALLPLVAVLERQIAAHPEQWVAALAPIWSDTPREAEGGGAATD